MREKKHLDYQKKIFSLEVERNLKAIKKGDISLPNLNLTPREIIQYIYFLFLLKKIKVKKKYNCHLLNKKF